LIVVTPPTVIDVAVTPCVAVDPLLAGDDDPLLAEVLLPPALLQPAVTTTTATIATLICLDLCLDDRPRFHMQVPSSSCSTGFAR
jgi:hypothetical protein